MGIKNKDFVDYLLEYWWLWISTFILIWYKISGWSLGYKSIDTITYYYFIFNLIFILARNATTAIRNSSPKLISNPVITTITGNYKTIGNYTIFRAGGLRAWEIEHETNEGTVIIPTSAVTIIGKSAIITSRIKEVEVEKLPPEVRNLIPQYNWRPPYLFGLADEIQEINRPDIIFLEKEIENLNESIQKYEKLLASTTKTMEDVISSQSRMNILAKRESILDKLKKSIISSDEDENI